MQHLRWLAELVLPHPCQQIALQEAVSTITERLVRLLVATGVIAELGDLSRFDHPRKLMSYLGRLNTLFAVFAQGSGCFSSTTKSKVAIGPKNKEIKNQTSPLLFLL